MMRILYYLFPDIGWIMIFVDDIIAIMNKLFETPLSPAIMFQQSSGAAAIICTLYYLPPDVDWTMIFVDDSWLFHGPTPRERVAPVELHGTLRVLEALIKETAVPPTHTLRLRAGTDNQGNSRSIPNNSSKSRPFSTIMMQLIWTAHYRNIELGTRHVCKGNRWADQLAGGDAPA